ncbi:MAG: phosphate butyryltransferase [Bacteroidales bacterium]|nr:phosphate butyryltransferase [Bacteroidales bacterium]
MIRTLDQMVEKVISLQKKQRIAVAWAQDPNTIGAVHKAVVQGIAEAVLIGNPDMIKHVCDREGLDPSQFTIKASADESEASAEAVRMAKRGEADIVMKGLVSTDVFLKAVMDKERGLMLPGATLAYVGAVQIPEYHKLLFLTDLAVIPFPGLSQKTAMAKYAIEMAWKFGITKPKVALLSATEKVSAHFPSTTDYVEMKKDAGRNGFGECIMDGPVDLFLACDSESVRIKGVNTPLAGDADILLFPSLESANLFYKALMLFGNGELAGILRGTSKPVVVMSRSESEKSKYYCIALSCLMAGD